MILVSGRESVAIDGAGLAEVYAAHVNLSRIFPGTFNARCYAGEGVESLG